MHTHQNLPHQFCFASHSFFFFLVFTADGIKFFTDNPVLNYKVWNKWVFSLGAGGLVCFIFQSLNGNTSIDNVFQIFFFKRNSSQNSCSSTTNCRENTEHVDFQDFADSNFLNVLQRSISSSFSRWGTQELLLKLKILLYYLKFFIVFCLFLI